MSIPTLTERWQRGETTLGLWVFGGASPIGVEILGGMGASYVCFDLQHGQMGMDSTVAAICALATSPSAPICRVPWNEPSAITKVLDAGATGVIVPMVNTAADAAAAVASTKYPPMGTRSFGPVRAARLWDGDYRSDANAAVACIPMIETAEAIENLDAIAAVPDIDALYIGPADLALSMGLALADAWTDPTYLAAIDRVRDACAANGLVAGIHADHASAPDRLLRGFQMVTVTTDTASLEFGAAAALAAAAPAAGQ